MKTPAWQRKEGKNPEGGLNAKGRASYNAANNNLIYVPSWPASVAVVVTGQYFAA